MSEKTVQRRPCSVQGCEKPAKHRGWCGMHYMRWWYHGDLIKRGPKGKPYHGFTGTRIMRIWVNMGQRCNNPNKKGYHNYGGKGIRVLWDSFESFRDDMYGPYLEHASLHGEKNTTIDRIDSNGHYCKENCRWATYKVQHNNKSVNLRIEHKGVVRSLAEWSDSFGVSYDAMWYRMFKKGMTFEEALRHKP